MSAEQVCWRSLRSEDDDSSNNNSSDNGNRVTTTNIKRTYVVSNFCVERLIILRDLNLPKPLQVKL